jgi:uncharacterized OB-fold protein
MAVRSASDVIGRVRARLRTTRCRGCGERYAKRLPYCPVCKHDPRGFAGVHPPTSPLGH